MSDCAEPGREELERESLSCRLRKDLLFLKGGDWSGEMVSCRSSVESRSSYDGRVMGENRGRGTTTDDSVTVEGATFSEDEILLTVCRRLGICCRPLSTV